MPIELVPIRVGPNALHSERELHEAFSGTELHGLVVLHDSHVRELTLDAAGLSVPVYYPPIWEGGRERPGSICTGESPEGKVWPSIEWLAENASATDWMIVGTDYLWPSGTARSVEPLLKRRGWWHGTHLVPYSLMDDLDGDERVVRQLVDAAEASSASCVLVLLHGTQMAMFNREFAVRGLDQHVLRFAPMADESVLLASGPESTQGLLTAFGIIDSDLPTGSAGFMERHSSLHGGNLPRPTGVTLAGYEGVAVAAAVAREVGHVGVSIAELAQVRARGFAFESPIGRVDVSRSTVRRPIHLLAADGVALTGIARLS